MSRPRAGPAIADLERQDSHAGEGNRHVGVMTSSSATIRHHQRESFWDLSVCGPPFVARVWRWCPVTSAQRTQLVCM